MQDQNLNDAPVTRVPRPDPEVEYLNSQISSLKLELATLISAVQEMQGQKAGVRLPMRAAQLATPRPSAIPAGLVVLIFAGLLSWQVVTNPRNAGPEVGSVAVALAPVASVTPAAPVTPEAPNAPEAPEAPKLYRGTLSVAADQPAAEVFVNRKPVGAAPVRLSNLRAGSHLVWVESEGHRRWTRVVTVPAEKVTRVAADLEPIEPVENDPR